MGRWGVEKANHNLILAMGFLYPQVPVLTPRFGLRPNMGADSRRRLVLLLFLPMFVKNFLTLSTLLGGWLHERGPAEYNIRRNDKIFETN